MGGALSFPAIRLDGQACAMHGDQWVWLALLIWAFIGWLAYECRHRRPHRTVTLGVLAILYPLFAFTGLFDLIRLLAGHGGELAFAGICFWRAWTGGFTHSFSERIAYSICAWFTFGQNIWFHLRLLTSSPYRLSYREGGSFGLLNDYVRVGQDCLGCSVQTVAILMLVVQVFVLPAAVLFGVRLWNGPAKRG